MMTFKEFLELKEAAPLEDWEREVSQDVSNRHNLKLLAQRQAAQKAAQQAANDKIFAQQGADWQKQSNAAADQEYDRQGQDEMKRRQLWKQMQDKWANDSRQLPPGSPLPSDYPADTFDYKYMKKGMKK